MCKNVIQEVDDSAMLFYNQNDLDQGYIVTKNRHGIEESFPILAIAIVVASCEKYKTIYDLSESMAKYKKVCKQKQGSNYMMT